MEEAKAPNPWQRSVQQVPDVRLRQEAALAGEGQSLVETNEIGHGKVINEEKSHPRTYQMGVEEGGV